MGECRVQSRLSSEQVVFSNITNEVRSASADRTIQLYDTSAITLTKLRATKIQCLNSRPYFTLLLCRGMRDLHVLPLSPRAARLVSHCYPARKTRGKWPSEKHLRTRLVISTSSRYLRQQRPVQSCLTCCLQTPEYEKTTKTRLSQTSSLARLNFAGARHTSSECNLYFATRLSHKISLLQINVNGI